MAWKRRTKTTTASAKAPKAKKAPAKKTGMAKKRGRPSKKAAAPVAMI